jgi:K+-sensing histidine kinase KdpD
LLANYLLALTRLHGERLQLAMTPVDFTNIAQTAAADQRAPGKRPIDVTGTQAHITGMADSERITFAMANPLHNAIKYSV